MNLVRLILVSLICVCTAPAARAFSFLGPFKSWQTTANGYQFNGEIGGPMLPSEGYRWNVPTIYYAFDRSFIEYFGPNGVAAVEAAIKVLNDLPNYSSLSRELTEFPLNTRQINYEAQSLGLIDVKSTAMAILMEEVGLANPEKNVWAIRSRDTANNITNYVITKLNYDPVTLRPSSYVNGALYTYEIGEASLDGVPFAVAGEIKVADLRTRGYTSVAGAAGAGADLVFQVEQDPITGGLVDANGLLGAGEYFFGLTRDDVGGLRKLYSPNTIANEASSIDVSLTSGGGGGGGPWGIPVGTTNAVGTNVSTALRMGMDRLRFQKISYDSLYGQALNPFTVSYNETFVTNSQMRTRSVQRIVTRPDILFSAKDLGTIRGGAIIFSRTTASAWINNSGINTHDGSFDDVFSPNDGNPGGPGVISGAGSSILITFTDVYPAYYGTDPTGTSESGALGPISWGSFDGSTNAPVLYPQFGGLTLDTLRSLSSNPAGVGNPWDVPFLTIGTNTTTTGVTTSP